MKAKGGGLLLLLEMLVIMLVQLLLQLMLQLLIEMLRRVQPRKIITSICRKLFPLVKNEVEKNTMALL
jgi:hypothetical protein